jgi:hypothetical protein
VRKNFLTLVIVAIAFFINTKSAYAFCFYPQTPDKKEFTFEVIIIALLLILVFLVYKKVVYQIRNENSVKNQTRLSKVTDVWLALGSSILSLVFALLALLVVVSLSFPNDSHFFQIPIFVVTLLILAIVLVKGGKKWALKVLGGIIIQAIAVVVYGFLPFASSFFNPDTYNPGIFIVIIFILYTLVILTGRKNGFNWWLGLILSDFAWVMIFFLIPSLNAFFHPGPPPGCGMPILPN